MVACSPMSTAAISARRTMFRIVVMRSSIAASRPGTPKRNGEVERYQQTVAREWAYGQRYRDSNARAQA